MSMKDKIIKRYLEKDLMILRDEGIIAETDSRVKSFIFVAGNDSHKELASIIQEILAKEIWNYDIENHSEDDDVEPYHIFDPYPQNINGDWVRCICTTEIYDPSEIADVMSKRV
ncbi:hypothetical protein QCI44_06715 [Bacillus cereus group sp. RP37]|uniref:hypothetical protein n=1 Tax=Bacillus cereus group sp. RP37 TaxID=3040259 RepID=UPI000BF6117E|nr:hypothetical protein COL27_14910 [Bacillus sp. AFS075960]PGU96517.1 hypothetical protein COD71_05705 [Bacillus cereus]HDR7655421.1 hypothetical protein [Bacillus wiedmannii]